MQVMHILYVQMFNLQAAVVSQATAKNRGPIWRQQLKTLRCLRRVHLGTGHRGREGQVVSKGAAKGETRKPLTPMLLNRIKRIRPER